MCVTPVTIRDPREVDVLLTVPCWHCFECRANRSAAWAFRLEQEEKQHAEAHFITLTYSDENLIWVGDKPTLLKSDLQKYWKRVRKSHSKHSKNKIKYYAVGEYGTKTHRPHYHAIVFGARADDLEYSWKAGHVRFETVCPAAIRYVTNYLCKSADYDVTDLTPEFSAMSKNLGLGYITPQMVKWHQQNAANYVVRPGGIRQALPRYYKDRIFDEDQRRELASEYIRTAELNEAKLIEKYGELEYYQRRNESYQAAHEAVIYKQEKRNKL